MADLLRASEENGHRLQTLESDVAKSRADQEQRLSTLEQRMSEAAAAAAAAPPAAEPAAEPKAGKPAAKPTAKVSAAPKAEGGPAVAAVSAGTAAATPTVDVAEDAYSQAFHLWEAGQYDDAIAALKSFTATYPKHRRASYANNLIGRSLLSKGQARDAAAAFLSNYRGNPSGERAPDSLYYLGQALIQLKKPKDACRVYGELQDVYGATLSASLKDRVSKARADAKCAP